MVTESDLQWREPLKNEILIRKTAGRKVGITESDLRQRELLKNEILVRKTTGSRVKAPQAFLQRWKVVEEHNFACESAKSVVSIPV